MLLRNLPASFPSAQTFLGLCSTVSGQQQPSSIAGKFQATGHNGADSCFIGRGFKPPPPPTVTPGPRRPRGRTPAPRAKPRPTVCARGGDCPPPPPPRGAGEGEKGWGGGWGSIPCR